MGVPFFSGIDKRNRDTVFEEITRAGFAVTQVAEATTHDDFILQRGRITLGISVHRPEDDPDEAVFEIYYPPYSLRVWRWGAEQAVFDELTGILDRFKRDTVADTSVDQQNPIEE